jgi:hypothetical protein
MLISKTCTASRRCMFAPSTMPNHSLKPSWSRRTSKNRSQLFCSQSYLGGCRGDKKWNPRILSNVGLTALQLAEKERNLELATFLRDKQAQWLLTTLRLRPMSSWPQLDVADWVEAIGFRQYRDLFWKNNIDGNALLRLDAESLKRDIGITSFGHREQIASSPWCRHSFIFFCS